MYCQPKVIIIYALILPPPNLNIKESLNLIKNNEQGMSDGYVKGGKLLQNAPLLKICFRLSVVASGATVLAAINI